MIIHDDNVKPVLRKIKCDIPKCRRYKNLTQEEFDKLDYGIGQVELSGGWVSIENTEDGKWTDFCLDHLT